MEGSDEKRILYVATNSREPPRGLAAAVRGVDGAALAKPLWFVCIWTDMGTRGFRDGSLWRPEAPEGYVALSDVAIHMNNHGLKPGVTKQPDDIDKHFRCVHKSFVESTELGNVIWTDAGTSGRYDGRVHGLRGSPGMIASINSRHHLPALQQHRLAVWVPIEEAVLSSGVCLCFVLSRCLP